MSWWVWALGALFAGLFGLLVFVFAVVALMSEKPK